MNRDRQTYPKHNLLVKVNIPSYLGEFSNASVIYCRANGGLGWRCLYSYLYYAEYYDDEYGYLSAYATNTGAVDCNYDYWFVEGGSLNISSFYGTNIKVYYY